MDAGTKVRRAFRYRALRRIGKHEQWVARVTIDYDPYLVVLMEVKERLSVPECRRNQNNADSTSAVLQEKL